MRRISSIVLLVIAGSGFWLFAWPQLGPYIMEYAPLLGDNRIAITQVAPGRNGTWDITVTYYNNNRRPGARIFTKVSSTPEGKEYQLNAGYNLPALPGEHTLTFHAQRPLAHEEIRGTKLIVEIKPSANAPAIVSASVDTKIAWADWETYSIGREVSDYPPDQVVARVAASAATGQMDKILHGKAILQALLARYPQHAAASAELVRIQSEAVWAEAGVRKLSAYRDLRPAVWSLRGHHGYEELDALAETLRTTGAVDINGHSMAPMFYRALNHMLLQEGSTRSEDFVNYEQGYHIWLKNRPQSSAARLALADMYVTLAANAQRSGNGTPEDATLYRGFVQKGFQALAACDSPECHGDPEWHRLVLQMMCVSRAPRETFGAAFAEAYGRFPDYLPIHRTGACYVLRTSSDPRDYATFAQQLGAKAPSDMADAVYMRAMTDPIDGFGPTFGRPTPAQFGIDCRRLVRGHEQWLKKFPSPENWNRAAAAAAQCGDKTAARRFLEHVSEPLLDWWGSDIEPASREFARVKAWAS